MNLPINKLSQAVKRLELNQGRVARRNARRAVLGAMQSLRHELDANWPVISKPQCERIDPVTVSAHRDHWRRFEYRTIRNVSRQFDFPMAVAFNQFAATRFGKQAKPILFDGFRKGSRIVGRHYRDKITIHPKLNDQDKWRTLLHEIAHYRVSGHRRSFVLELATVYGLWKEFLTMRNTETAIP